MTLIQRYQRYFEAHGFVEYHSKSKKYICMRKSRKYGIYTYVHLGKSGSVLVSLTGNVTEASPVRYRTYLEHWERENTEKKYGTLG